MFDTKEAATAAAAAEQLVADLAALSDAELTARANADVDYLQGIGVSIQGIAHIMRVSRYTVKKVREGKFSYIPDQ